MSYFNKTHRYRRFNPFIQLYSDIIGEVIAYIQGRTLYHFSISSREFNNIVRKMKTPTIESYICLHYKEDYPFANLSSDLKNITEQEMYTNICLCYHFVKEVEHKKIVLNFIETKKLIPSTKKINNFAMLLMCRFGDLTVFSNFLKNHNVNVPDFNFGLRHSSKYGNLFVVKFLINTGKIKPIDCDYAIIQASSNGHLDVIKYLFAIGNLNYDEKYYSIKPENLKKAIYSAAKKGYLEIVKFLSTISLK